MAKILERRQLTVRVPNSTYEDLRAISDALKISITDFTAAIIVDALAKKSAEISRLKELLAGEQQRQLEMQARAAEIWGVDDALDSAQKKTPFATEMAADYIEQSLKE